jgi:hypothetical protein
LRLRGEIVKITIEVLRVGEIRRAFEALAEKAPEKMVMILNQQIKEISDDIIPQKICTIYNIAPARIMKGLNTKLAGSSKTMQMSASTKTNSASKPGLYSFKNTKQNEIGVTYQIKVGKQELMPHAFIQRANNAIIVLMRYKEGDKFVQKYKVNAKKGPSIPIMIQDKSVIEPVMDTVEKEYLRKMDKVLTDLKGIFES